MSRLYKGYRDWGMGIGDWVNKTGIAAIVTIYRWCATLKTLLIRSSLLACVAHPTKKCAGCVSPIKK